MTATTTTTTLEMLLDLLDRDADERIAVCSNAGGTFRSNIVTVGTCGPEVDKLAGGNVWYSTSPLHPRVTTGRGAAGDAVGLRELFADLDVKPGGMTDFAAADAVIADLSTMLGVQPVAVVETGHGLQPHWRIERDADVTDWGDEQDPRWLAARVLQRRWGRLVAFVAEQHGGAADSVFDLARVLRAPGTTNRKDDREPVPTALRVTGGAPVSVNRIREALDEYGITELPEDGRTIGEIVAPHSDWAYGTKTCSYVNRMVAGWRVDTPPGRHPWLTSQAVRLAAAHRLGCLTPDDHRAAITTLADRFALLLASPPVRAPLRREVADALAWCVRVVEGKTETEARNELGGHEHPPALTTFEPMPVPGAVADADGTVSSSWADVDLGPFLDGTHVPTVPTLFPRIDGVCLVYPGLTHSFHGESESGKSLLLQIESARVIMLGEEVVYLDFESDPASVVERLIMFGASREAIREHLHYIHPEAAPDAVAARADWERLLAGRYALVVIDGLTMAYALLGPTPSNDQDGVAAWAARYSDTIAHRTGAAVVVIDHVTKDAETRGRHASGSQMKMGTLSGAAYTIKIGRPIGLGLCGDIVMRVAKDRPGRVRGHGVGSRADQTQEIARVEIDSTEPGATLVTINPPNVTTALDGKGGFRPTFLMERASRFIEVNAGCSQRTITDGVKGKVQSVRDAIAALIAEEYVTVAIGDRSSKLHTVVTPYREADDRVPDALPDFTGTSTASASLSMTGDAGRSQMTASRTQWDAVGTQSSRTPIEGSGTGPAPDPSHLRPEAQPPVDVHHTCPECGKPTTPNRAGHRTLCLRCSLAEVDNKTVTP